LPLGFAGVDVVIVFSAGFGIDCGSPFSGFFGFGWHVCVVVLVFVVVMAGSGRVSSVMGSICICTYTDVVVVGGRTIFLRTESLHNPWLIQMSEIGIMIAGTCRGAVLILM
jgi:hypothetical protein